MHPRAHFSAFLELSIFSFAPVQNFVIFCNLRTIFGEKPKKSRSNYREFESRETGEKSTKTVPRDLMKSRAEVAGAETLRLGSHGQQWRAGGTLRLGPHGQQWLAGGTPRTLLILFLSGNCHCRTRPFGSFSEEPF